MIRNVTKRVKNMFSAFRKKKFFDQNEYKEKLCFFYKKNQMCKVKYIFFLQFTFFGQHGPYCTNIYFG